MNFNQKTRGHVTGYATLAEDIADPDKTEHTLDLPSLMT